MFERVHHLIGIALAISLSSPVLRAERADPPKVIIETDFNTIFDDGQVAVMAAQLYSQGTIDLLGFTVPSGNQWRDQGVSDCLKAVERLVSEHRVKVYVGSQYPLLHDYQSYLYEQLLFGQPIRLYRRIRGPSAKRQSISAASRWVCHTYETGEERRGPLHY